MDAPQLGKGSCEPASHHDAVTVPRPLRAELHLLQDGPQLLLLPLQLRNLASTAEGRHCYEAGSGSCTTTRPITKSAAIPQKTYPWPHTNCENLDAR